MENKTEGKPEDETADDGINLLDYFIILAKHKKIIITITLTASIITVLYSLSLPSIYRADARIISQGEPNRNAFLSGEFLNILGTNISQGGFSDPSVIISVIKSRTLYNRIIERFGLMDVFGTEDMENARSALDGSLQVSREKSSSIIVIAVMNEDPQLAADMANAFVEELISFLQNSAFKDASKKRVFFENKLKETREALIKSEEAMREFQETTGMLKIEEQASAVIESIASMRARIAVKEVEIKVMKTYSTANNPDLQIVQEELIGLKAELKKLEEKGGSSPDTLMPTGRMPVVGTKHIRILRDLKFNEGLVELISKQYEMARIEEAKEPAVIKVLDKAVVPTRKFGPRRRSMVTMAAVVSFFSAVFLAFIIDFYQNYQARNIENKKRVETLKKYLFFRKMR